MIPSFFWQPAIQTDRAYDLRSGAPGWTPV